MRRGSAAAWVFLLFSASSCLQILGVDVDKYEDDAEKPIPCNTVAECDDLNPCTLDACGATKLCEHKAVADGPSDLQLPGDCQRIDCNGAWMSSPERPGWIGSTEKVRVPAAETRCQIME